MSNGSSTSSKTAIVTLWSTPLFQSDNCTKLLEILSIKGYPYVSFSTVKSAPDASDQIASRKQVVLTLYQWRQLLGKACGIDFFLTQLPAINEVGLKVIKEEVLATAGSTQKRVQVVALDGKVFVSIVEFFLAPGLKVFVPTKKSVFLTPIEFRILVQQSENVEIFLKLGSFQATYNPGI